MKLSNHARRRGLAFYLTALVAVAQPCSAQPGEPDPNYPLPYPPALPGGATIVTDESPAFLKSPGNLRDGVEIARTPPKIDFMYYAAQDYPGDPWSAWGDGCTAGEKYYSAIGDHRSPRGNAFVFEYDPGTRELRLLVDLRKFLETSGAMPRGSNYTPGKVHSRIDMGQDGWLYYATHRGSPRTSNDEHGYQGDWVLRTDPKTGTTEVVVAHPIPKHSIPTSVLDPKRMIFYGGTAPGEDAASQVENFFAYDIRNKKLLAAVEGGPKRYAILSASSGRLFWNGRMFDPDSPGSIASSEAPEVRSATQETPQGIVYGTTGHSAEVWAFDVKKQTVTSLGDAAVGKQGYVTTIDADPTGRYLYFVAGAHGGGSAEGTPVVQFDVQTRTRKVIAFVHPFYLEKYGYTPDGTFSSALDEKGEKLFITWNGMRKGQPRFWESCALMVVHIPASERP